MEINIKLNNMVLTDDISKLRFGELTVGQQLLVLENKQTQNLEIEYNNIITAFLTKKEKGCMYYFEGVNTNAEVYEDERDPREGEDPDYSYFEVGGSEYNAKNYERMFLVLSEEQQLKIDLKKSYINDLDLENTGDRDTSRILDFKEMISIIGETKYISSKRIIDVDDKGWVRAKFLLCVPVDNDCFIGYGLYDDIKSEDHYWSKHEEMFLFDQTFTWYVDLDCDMNKAYEQILKLDCTRWSSQLNEFKDVWLPAFKYDTGHYMVKPLDIFTVYKAFEYTWQLSHSEIEKYYKPFYEEKEYDLKFYMRSVTSYHAEVKYTYDSKKLPGYSWDPNVKAVIEPATRKAKAILQFLKKSSIIDPFTGDPINNDNFDRTVTWHDAGGKIIESIGKNDRARDKYTNCFTDLNGIFVEAEKEEKKDMEDRIKLVNKLTQLPVAK